MQWHGLRIETCGKILRQQVAGCVDCSGSPDQSALACVVKAHCTESDSRDSRLIHEKCVGYRRDALAATPTIGYLALAAFTNKAIY